MVRELFCALTEGRMRGAASVVAGWALFLPAFVFDGDFVFDGGEEWSE